MVKTFKGAGWRSGRRVTDGRVIAEAEAIGRGRALEGGQQEARSKTFIHLLIHQLFCF